MRSKHAVGVMSLGAVVALSGQCALAQTQSRGYSIDPLAGSTLSLEPSGSVLATPPSGSTRSGLAISFDATMGGALSTSVQHWGDPHVDRFGITLTKPDGSSGTGAWSAAWDGQHVVESIEVAGLGVRVVSLSFSTTGGVLVLPPRAAEFSTALTLASNSGGGPLASEQWTVGVRNDGAEGMRVYRTTTNPRSILVSPPGEPSFVVQDVATVAIGIVCITSPCPGDGTASIRLSAGVQGNTTPRSVELMDAGIDIAGISVDEPGVNFAEPRLVRAWELSGDPHVQQANLRVDDGPRARMSSQNNLRMCTTRPDPILVSYPVGDGQQFVKSSLVSAVERVDAQGQIATLDTTHSLPDCNVTYVPSTNAGGIGASAGTRMVALSDGGTALADVVLATGQFFNLSGVCTEEDDTTWSISVDEPGVNIWDATQIAFTGDSGQLRTSTGLVLQGVRRVLVQHLGVQLADATMRVQAQCTSCNCEAGDEGFLMGVVGPRACDSIDFNNDGLFPDDTDLLDLLSVLAGGACPGTACNDIDFNNDGLFPDDSDLLAFLTVLAGGTCE